MRLRLLALMLCACVSAGAQTAADVAKKYNEAAALVREKKFNEAVVALNSTIQMGLKAGPEALANVQAAQKLLPVCNFRIAVRFAGASEFEKALEQNTKAAELAELYGDMSTMNNTKKLSSQIYTKMAANAFNAKDYATAATIFERGYSANKLDTEIGLNLALSYSEMGVAGNAEAKAKGMQVYREIMALASRHSRYQAPAAQAQAKVVYYLMLDASAAAKAKNNAGVFAATDEILKINGKDAIARMLRLQTATNMKDWNKVISEGEATAAAQTTPELKSDAYFLLGAAYQNKENKASAIATYNKVTAGGKVATAKEQVALLSK